MNKTMETPIAEPTTDPAIVFVCVDVEDPEESEDDFEDFAL